MKASNGIKAYAQALIGIATYFGFVALPLVLNAVA